MQRRLLIRPESRSGLTRIEVLVLCVIAIVCGLVVVPGVLSRRIPARRMECVNSIHIIGLSVMNSVSTNDGHLPPLSTSISVVNAKDEEGELLVGWPIALLPSLDQSALLKGIRQRARVEMGRAKIGDAERLYIPVFACPADEGSVRVPGGLSYVVNAGFISRDLYNGDPDGNHVLGSLAWIGEPNDDDSVHVHAATGVMWQTTDRFQPSLDYISDGDGSATTILITENLQAGDWYDIDGTKIGFGFPVANSEGKVPLGTGATFESAKKPLNTQFEGGNLASEPQDWRINRDLKIPSGSRPRPSSNHTGGVNVIMCDGASRFLSENIDPHVYLKLITSNGVKYGEGDFSQSQY